MNDDAAFLNRIQDTPHDHVSRLVYADWLDEQSDPRAEFLRLSCRVMEDIRRLATLKKELSREWIEAVDRCHISAILR